MNAALRQPVILDFDASIGPLPDELRQTWSSWQEAIRFGCRWPVYHRFETQLAQTLPAEHGCVFLGSGDFHHLTYALLRRRHSPQPVQLIVCDNHPDNMRYPFGIHCGSWVYWASRLAHVAHIHVLGITSGDITARHAWENHWSPLRAGKLTYWSVRADCSWLRRLGAVDSGHCFDSADALLDAFLPALDTTLPVYLSIDKDVLDPTVVRTNWDQGVFCETHLDALISHCARRIIGADLCGEASAYRYSSRFKRWLSAADGQCEPSAVDIAAWQPAQQALNQRLLASIHTGWRTS